MRIIGGRAGREAGLAVEAGSRLRVGVVGLGPPWGARHRPALVRLRDRIEIAAVYDEVPWRAEVEARALGCRAAAGMVALVESPDVDAICVTGRAWYGLHPLTLAAGSGKPAFWRPVTADGADELDAIGPLARAPIVPDFARRHHPASARLVALIDGELGSVTAIEAAETGELGDRLDLIDWCRWLCRTDPVAARPGPGGLVEIDFGGGRSARIGPARADRPDPAAIELRFDRGTATIGPPESLAWESPTARGDEQLPASPPPADAAWLGFLRAIRGEPGGPTWADAVAAARIAEQADTGDTRPEHP